VKIAMVGMKGITLSPGGGGIENFVQELGVRLVKRGHTVCAYTRPYYEEVRGKFRGIKLIRLPSINTKHLDTLTHTFLSAADSLFRTFDIVHFHGVGTALMTFLPRLTKTKTVLHIHAPDWLMDKWGLGAKMFLKASNYPSAFFPNKVAVVSRGLQSYYKERFGINASYIPGGINDCNFRQASRILSYGLDQGNFLLFSAGLRPQKGCHYLIKAFRLLSPELKLVITGGSQHSDDYVADLHQLAGDHPNIIFLGFVDDETMAELYSNAFIYVQPSEVEGFSHALQQAMGYGNCIIASAIPPNIEVLQDHGYYFPINDVKGLVSILSRLINDHSLVTMKKEKARHYAKEYYNWNNITINLEKLYYETISPN